MCRQKARPYLFSNTIAPVVVSGVLKVLDILSNGFFFPVVPNGQAKIRTQVSAGHEKHHLEKALDAFIKVGRKYEILGKTKQEIIDRYGM